MTILRNRPVLSVSAILGLFAFDLNSAPVRLKRPTDIHSTIAIRVLLETGPEEAWIQSQNRALQVRRAGSSTWSPLLSDALVERGGKNHLILNRNSTSSQSILIRNVKESGTLLYKSSSYRGLFQISHNGVQNGIMITNIVPLDSYLMGQLGSEMHTSWELEALKAQAVASRTYAMYRMRHPRNARYDLNASTLDQVYAGVAVESRKVKQAIFETTGEVLLKNRKPIQSFYHSRCGGMTEYPDQVWKTQAPSYQKGVHCSYCRNSSFTWSASVSHFDLHRLLNLTLTPPENLRIVSLAKSSSGRILDLRVESGRQQKVMSTDHFRNLLGYSKLKSTRFKWEIKANGDVVFEGIGSGHGVGMCQWGAQYLARQGKSYRAILAHYFPGIEVKRYIP